MFRLKSVFVQQKESSLDDCDRNTSPKGRKVFAHCPKGIEGFISQGKRNFCFLNPLVTFKSIITTLPSMMKTKYLFPNQLFVLKKYLLSCTF